MSERPFFANTEDLDEAAKAEIRAYGYGSKNTNAPGSRIVATAPPSIGLSLTEVEKEVAGLEEVHNRLLEKLDLVLNPPYPPKEDLDMPPTPSADASMYRIQIDRIGARLQGLRSRVFDLISRLEV